MNDLEWAYLAGIIDGEGTITIVTPYASARGGRAEVSVANTSPLLIAWLRDTGYGRIVHKSRAKAWHKQAWTWNVRGAHIKPVLAGIEPYLVVKREQARIVREFLTLVRPNSHRPFRLSDAAVAQRIDLQQRVRLLNKRGDQKEQDVG